MEGSIISNNSILGNVIDLIGHLIWPTIVLVFILIFRGKILNLFDSLKKLKFSDIEAEFEEREKTFAEQEVSPLNDELDGLIKRIEKLEQASQVKEKEKSADEPKHDEKAIKNKITDALENGPYRWRSIPKLASLSGTTENEVLEILRMDNNVILSMGKSGRRIARMKNK